MKILIPADTLSKNPSNPYQVQLIQALRHEPIVEEVGYGAGLLHWERPLWDVIHVQWPEAVFGWKKPSRRALTRVELELKKRRRRTAVVATVHNLFPAPAFEEMGGSVFEIIYSNTDAFIHFGQASLEAFKERWKNKCWFDEAAHYVIPHGDYSYYSRLEQDPSILNGLRVAGGGRLVLVFGGLRTAEEEELAREAFYAADCRDARLVFAGNPTRTAIPREILHGKLDRPDKRIIRMHRRIEDPQVQPLFKVASVVFVPRAGRLNSGVVPLAITYGVPVVAPDEGVIGETLREAGGFLYAPANRADAALQLRRALSMTPGEREALAERMEDYRRRKLSWRSIAREHLRVYIECISSKRALPEISPQVGKLYRSWRIRANVSLAARARRSPSIRRAATQNEGVSRANTVCFTIALNGYEKQFRECIRTQERYCLRYGYTYWRIDDLPWIMSAKQCAWLKVEVMRGLLNSGAAHVGFLDADCEFRPHTPPFESEYGDRIRLLMARGKSGRLNSGIMFGRAANELYDFLEMLIRNSDYEVPKEDRTTYENGHFIHYGRSVDFIGVLDHRKWNNNSRLDSSSFVQHYSRGELRRWWNSNRRTARESAQRSEAKEDLTALSMQDFLFVARSYLRRKYSRLVSTERRIVVN